MALERKKHTVVKHVDEINFFDLTKAVEELLSKREGRTVRTRDYGGRDEASRLAFIETSKLGDHSWFGTQFTKFTEVQQKQYDIYHVFVDHIPYMDFWHWWIDHVDTEVSNDSTSEIEWGAMFEQLVEELEQTIEEFKADGEDAHMPEFHLTVLKAYNEVLLTIYTQEELDDTIQIHYSW